MSYAQMKREQGIGLAEVEQTGLGEVNNAKLNQLLYQLRTQKRHQAQTVMSEQTAAKILSQPVPAPQPEVTSLVELRQVLNSTAQILILDLEFYGGKGTRVAQLAGQVYGSHERFNYLVFAPEAMTDAQQLKFLKETNLPYLDATKLDLTAVIERVNQFMHRQQIDYILGYDNHLDWRILNEEAKRYHWTPDQCFWKKPQDLDLEAILRQDALAGKTGISLQSLVGLLGINRELPFHQAQNDVTYMARVLQYYAHNINEEII